jgi:hypothetical protein
MCPESSAGQETFDAGRPFSQRVSNSYPNSGDDESPASAHAEEAGAPRHVYLDGTNLSEDDRAAVDMTTLITFAALPDAISFLYVLYYIHAAGGYNRMEGIEDGHQRWMRFAGGSQAIALKMAAALGDVVRLSSPVTEIRGWDGAGPVELATAEGAVMARRAILALSPSQAGGIRFEPALPAGKAGLIKAWPRSGASGIKTFVSYDRPFWRQQGLSGDIYNLGRRRLAGRRVDRRSRHTGPDRRRPDHCAAQAGDPGVLRYVLRARSARSDRLRRTRLGAGDLHPRLRLAARAGRADQSRSRTARDDRASALGGHGNRHAMDRLPGRRHPRRPARRHRGPRGACPGGMRWIQAVASLAGRPLP